MVPRGHGRLSHPRALGFVCCRVMLEGGVTQCDIVTYADLS